MRPFYLPAVCLAVLAVTTTARAETPQPAPCKTTRSYKVKLEGPRQLENGTIEYYGRFVMWPPIDNPKCHLRQLLVSVPRLANDDKPLSPSSPVINAVVRHGLFHRPSTDLRVYQVVLQAVTPTAIEYEIDAEAKATEIKNGAYYLQLSIVGTPRS